MTTAISSKAKADQAYETRVREIAVKRGLIQPEKILRTPEQQAQYNLCLNRETDTDGIEYFFKHFLKTTDPRENEDVRTVQFELFPIQVELLKWIVQLRKERRGGKVPKSREAGVSYFFCGYAIWCFLFENRCQIGMGSNQLDSVDKIGDEDTLFGKLRVMMKSLPEWMMPEDWNWNNCSKLGLLINPNTGALIKGEGGKEMGRGGRNSWYLVDEAAFVEYPDLIDGSLSRNTNCRFDVSTYRRSGDPFDQKVKSGLFPVFEMPWITDPRKNKFEIRNHKDEIIYQGSGKCSDELLMEYSSNEGVATCVYPWYEEAKRNTPDPVIFAREVDMNPDASIDGICIPAEWVKLAVNLVNKPQFKFKFPEYINQKPKVAGMDVAAMGDNKTVLTMRKGIEVYMPISWKLDTTNTAHRAVKECTEQQAEYLYYDLGGLGEGVASALQNFDYVPNVSCTGINSGATPSDMMYPGGETGKQLYGNLRAENYIRLRKRFENVYEFLTHGVEHDPDDMISIPDCPQLVTELSRPLIVHTRGKMYIESKADMKKRHIPSPDYADSLMLTECFIDFNWSAVNKQLDYSLSQSTRFTSVAW